MRFLPPLFASLMSAIVFENASSSAVLTPERLIAAPRPGNGVANPAGDRALIGCRTYSFENDAFSEALYSINLPQAADKISQAKPETNQLHSISKKSSAGFWLSNDIAAYVDSSDNKVYARDVSTKHLDDDEESWHTIGQFDSPINDVKVARDSQGIATTLVVSAQVYSDGNLSAVKEHDESEAVKEWQRVKIYDSTFVRHWDRWIDGKRTQVFAIDLKHGKSISEWAFSGEIRNLMNGTTLAIPPPPNGGEDDWSVSESHVVFTSKDPNLTPSWHTKQNVSVPFPPKNLLTEGPLARSTLYPSKGIQNQ